VAGLRSGAGADALAHNQFEVECRLWAQLDCDLNLAGTRSGRLRDIDDAQDVFWSSELGDLDSAHVGCR
jgi:hypothetical protein